VSQRRPGHLPRLILVALGQQWCAQKHVFENRDARFGLAASFAQFLKALLSQPRPQHLGVSRYDPVLHSALGQHRPRALAVEAPVADRSPAPLAERMRPRTFDEFVGQEQLVGERGPLRRSVARGHLSSLLLWGPPGTGKTSLARLLADTIGADFHSLSAVMSGVAEVRATIAGAQERLTLEGRRSVLFIDEIHRFNKAQQDALLPHVEDGTVTLVGATTENPYFEVNSALLSRMRVWRLEPLTDEDIAPVRERIVAALGEIGGELRG